ncbi:hypothetical protein V8F20_008051 [Naviculisporaceae sp. PSN 640]
MRPMSCCNYCGRDVGERRWPPAKTTLSSWISNWVSETTEIVLGTICGYITWQFMVQNESARGQECGNNNGQDAAGCRDFDISRLFTPSPALMLVSCLVFGCCVSSFVHRRQDKDPLQFLVYLVLLGSVVIAGYQSEASANMILLGYLPWTMCLAMATSITGHSLYRQWRQEVDTRLGEMEKGEVLL